MRTKFIEACDATNFNYGKFMVGRFEADELLRQTALSLGRSLLSTIGWDRNHIIVFDLQTCEGAAFRPGGYATADLNKHKVWVCPMFEPFLAWLYLQDLTDLDALPSYVNLGNVPTAMHGYRRKGVDITVPEADDAPVAVDLLDGRIIAAVKVPVGHSCNRHNDCDAADKKARDRGAHYGTDHCHDDECEDCFGC